MSTLLRNLMSTRPGIAASLHDLLPGNKIKATVIRHFTWSNRLGDFRIPVTSPQTAISSSPFSILANSREFRPRQIANILIMQKRFKKKAPAKAAVEEDEDLEDLTDEVVEEDDGGEPRDWKDLKISVYSPRADSVLKVGLKTSRTKVEEAFYEGKWRINGEKVSKKSTEISPGDEIDVIVGSNENNPDFLDVSRILIEDIGTALIKSKVEVSIKIWKKLVVENYKPPNKYTLTGS